MLEPLFIRRCAMGLYLNPWAEAFLEAVNPEIYVDKTGPLQTSNNETKEIVHNGRSLCVTISFLYFVVWMW